jgi:hypothetical protein
MTKEKSPSIRRLEVVMAVGGALAAAYSLRHFLYGRASSEQIEEEVAKIMPSPEKLSELTVEEQEEALRNAHKVVAGGQNE